MKKINVLIVCIFFSLFPAFSQWQQYLGPFGGSVRSFGVDGNTGYIYAGTYGNDIFISKDAGNNWQQVNNPNLSQNTMSVSTISFNNNKVFIGEGVNVCSSNDNGLNWTKVGEKLNNNVQCIGFNGTNILAGTQYGVYLKSEQNNAWIPIDNGLTKKNVRCMLVIGNNIYIGTDGGIFLSDNNGSSWQSINNGLPANTEILSFLKVENNIFIGTMDGVYLSTNNGTTWVSVNNGLPLSTNENDCWSLVLSGNKIFAALSSVVYMTSDNGANWNEVSSALPYNSQSFTVLAALGNTTLASRDLGGIYKTNDDGTHWNLSNNGFVNTNISCIAYKNGKLFASTFDGNGMFLSSDGNNWSSINNGLPYGYVSSISVNDDAIFLAMGATGIFSSENEGNSWTQINNDLPQDISVLSIYSNESTIFIGTNMGVYISNNKGINWNPANNGISNLSVGSLKTNGSILYAGTNNGIYKSMDNGSNWVQLGFNGKNIGTFAVNGNMILASVNDSEFYLSNDGGNSWIESNNGLSYYENVKSIAFNNDFIFLGANGGGIYCSIDNGKNWVNITDNLHSTVSNFVALNDEYLFSAPFCGGVAKRQLSNIKLLLANFDGADDPSDDEIYLDIVSNTTWTISSDQTWLTVNPNLGTGTARVKVSAQANPFTTVRTATFTISGTGISDQLFTITQDAAAPALNVSTSTVSITAGLNSTGTFDITSNISWNIQTDQTWLTLSSTSGSNNSQITITALENTSLQARTATLTISASGVSDKTVIITQDAAAPVLNVSTSTVSITSVLNSTGTFNISSNTSWGIQSDQTWLTLSPTSGSNSSQITVTATENTSIQARSVTLTISASGVSDRSVVITQEGAVPVLNVSSNTLTVSAGSNSTGSFDITSNTSWAIQSDQNWLTVSITSGTNNNQITLTASENTSTQARSATLTVSATGIADKKITVTQEGAAPILNVSKNSISIEGAGGNSSFDITANYGWSIECDQTWISYSSSSGNGNSTIILTFQENTLINSRTATIKVKGTGSIERSISITQNPLATGINEIDKDLILLFPNPTHDFIQVKGVSLDATITILDQKGVIWLKDKAEKLPLDISKIPNGIYILRINNNQGFVDKILVKN